VAFSLPAQGAGDTRLLRYASAAVKQGDEFLKNCDGFDLIQPCLDLITSKQQSAILADLERPANLATTCTNRFKKIAFELVAGMTDIKPFWEIKTYNPRFEQHANIFSKVSSWWYTAVNADQDGLANCLRWAICAGTGYVHLFWDPRPDRHNIYATAPDPRDVIPIRPRTKGQTSTLQDCLGVVVRENTTVSFVEELFPDFEGSIRPDYQEDEGSSLNGTRAGRILKQIAAETKSTMRDVLFGDKPNNMIGKEPTVDLFTMYIKDFSINDSESEVLMGEWMDDPEYKPEGLIERIAPKAPQVQVNNWSYKVKSGDRLYPRGRMVIFTRSTVLYDGPSMYWHGQFPIIKLTLDPWPSTFLGTAIMWDLLSLQSSLNWNLRVVDDHNAQVAQPGAIGNSREISKPLMEAFNTRKAGWKLLANINAQSLQIVNPPPLDNAIPGHIQYIEKTMDEQAGLVDLKSVSNLNQTPNSDTVEKIIETQSMLLRGRSRVIEAFMREFARQLIFNISQFMTLQDLYMILGPQGITPDAFDFDNGTFIPDFVHAEDFDKDGNLKPDAMLRGPRPRYDRVKVLIDQMAYQIAPGSLLAGSAVTKKLEAAIARRDGLMDIWTYAEVMGWSGYGEPPAGANTVPERIKAEIAMGIGYGAQQGGDVGRPPVITAPPSFSHNGVQPVIRQS
jgi:hypothetical protein